MSPKTSYSGGNQSSLLAKLPDDLRQKLDRAILAPGVPHRFSGGVTNDSAPDAFPIPPSLARLYKDLDLPAHAISRAAFYRYARRLRQRAARLTPPKPPDLSGLDTDHRQAILDSWSIEFACYRRNRAKGEDINVNHIMRRMEEDLTIDEIVNLNLGLVRIKRQDSIDDRTAAHLHIARRRLDLDRDKLALNREKVTQSLALNRDKLTQSLTLAREKLALEGEKLRQQLNLPRPPQSRDRKGAPSNAPNIDDAPNSRKSSDPFLPSAPSAPPREPSNPQSEFRNPQSDRPTFAYSPEAPWGRKQDGSLHTREEFHAELKRRLEDGRDPKPHLRYDPAAPWGRKPDRAPYTRQEFNEHMQRCCQDLYGIDFPVEQPDEPAKKSVGQASLPASAGTEARSTNPNGRFSPKLDPLPAPNLLSAPSASLREPPSIPHSEWSSPAVAGIPNSVQSEIQNPQSAIPSASSAPLRAPSNPQSAITPTNRLPIATCSLASPGAPGPGG